MEKVNKIKVFGDREGYTNQECPYARRDLGVVIMGDYQCRRCEHYKGCNNESRTIFCTHPQEYSVTTYATDEELRERWRHINLLKIEADTMFDENDEIRGVKVWPIEGGDIIKRDSNMEKKKMTKAEAFEWLKGKKVYLETASESTLHAVVNTLHSCGFTWYSEDEVDLDDDTLAIFLGEDGIMFFVVREDRWFYLNHAFVPLSADDILSIEIVEEEKTMDAKALDEITELGKRISGLLSVLGGGHVRITVDDVTLYGEGMNLFHTDPF